MLRKFLVSACAAATVLVSAGPAAAQTRSDRATYFTFSQPVALPKVTLPAGRYLFRILDSQVSRSVVQVFDAGGTKLYAMLLTIPAQRNDPSDDPEVRFLETPENAPAAIATWWYPGEKTGWEFVYPREQALILAKSSGQPVLATVGPSATVEDMRKAELVRVTPSGDTPVVEAKPGSPTAAGRSQRGEVATGAAPAASQTPPPQQTQPRTQPAQPQTPPAPRPTTPDPATPPATDPASQPARTQLPATFGFLPLIGVIGGIALVTGVAMRRRNGRRNMTSPSASTGSTGSTGSDHRGA